MRSDGGTLISSTSFVGFLSEHLQSATCVCDIINSDLQPSNLEVYYYMPADHGEGFQIQVLFALISFDM